MQAVTLFAAIVAVFLVVLVKRMLRPSMPVHSDTSTYQTALAEHIVNTTRSAGRNLYTRLD
ncbi:MAG: hypothetical protein OES46_21235 [Gammaproteobacteria bacterium]|nr:hypothetical protein [Gammaproteobacteria bacterium]